MFRRMSSPAPSSVPPWASWFHRHRQRHRLAVAIGIPTATLVQQLNILVMTTNVALVHGADKAIESGKFNAVNKFFWTGACASS